MSKIDWNKLQNGSDIRGVALEGVEGQHVNLNADTAKIIGIAFGLWLSEKKSKELNDIKVAVGHDSRLSAKPLTKAVVEGITSLGIHVADFELASTPAMFMATVTEGYMFDGSIMLTASHLPFNRNGLKFFTSEGGLEKADITKILKISDQIHEGIIENNNKIIGTIERINFINVYSDILVKRIREGTKEQTPLEGFRIVVDAGNGAGGFFADKVLKPLGADTTGSQFLDPDGSFPNHIPNPEDEEAMQSICDAVLANKADFGIIFDTDVDRAGAVDRLGREINRNRIIALIAAIAIEEKPGATIVTDSITSEGLKTFIEDHLGGKHHRFKRGYKNVINEAIRLNRAGIYTPVAIETSGHGALIENYFLDDGAYLIAKILIKMAKLKKDNKTIDDLIECLEEPYEAKEFRMNINLSDFKEYGMQVIDGLEKYAKAQKGWSVEPVNYEGIRVKCDKGFGDGWFLLRLSLHDPLLPLNIESDIEGGVLKIAKQLKSFFDNYENLDISAFTKFVEA